MTVLVTGGLGYIGRHLALEMKQPGMFIDAKWDEEDARIIRNAGHHVSCVDVQQVTAEFLHRHGIRRMVHLAAHISVAEGETNRRKYYLNNTANTAKMAALAAGGVVDRFVFASSAAVYPGDMNFVSRRTAPAPDNYYGETKLIAEEVLAALLTKESGTALSILRFFNVIGADPEGRTGKHGGSDALSCMMRHLSKGTEFIMYGDDWSTPDGTAVRDYVHVRDVVGAILEELARPHAISTVRNVARGEGTSLAQLSRMLEIVAQKRLHTKKEPPRLGDVGHSVCRLSSDDYTGKLSVEEAVRDAWRWYSNLYA